MTVENIQPGTEETLAAVDVSSQSLVPEAMRGKIAEFFRTYYLEPKVRYTFRLLVATLRQLPPATVDPVSGMVIPLQTDALAQFGLLFDAFENQYYLAEITDKDAFLAWLPEKAAMGQKTGEIGLSGEISAGSEEFRREIAA